MAKAKKELLNELNFYFEIFSQPSYSKHVRWDLSDSCEVVLNYVKRSTSLLIY